MNQIQFKRFQSFQLDTQLATLQALYYYSCSSTHLHQYSLSSLQDTPDLLVSVPLSNAQLLKSTADAVYASNHHVFYHFSPSLDSIASVSIPEPLQCILPHPNTPCCILLTRSGALYLYSKATLASITFDQPCTCGIFQICLIFSLLESKR
jgi:hypothetical protein